MLCPEGLPLVPATFALTELEAILPEIDETIQCLNVEVEDTLTGNRLRELESLRSDSSQLVRHCRANPHVAVEYATVSQLMQQLTALCFKVEQAKTA